MKNPGKEYGISVGMILEFASTKEVAKRTAKIANAFFALLFPLTSRSARRKLNKVQIAYDIKKIGLPRTLENGMARAK